MSGAIINPQNLARFARDSDLEIRMRPAGQDGSKAVDEESGSLGGRLIRNLKIFFGSAPGQAEKDAIMAAKRQTLADLKATFGDDIGERAFRAHVGESDGQGGWISSAAHPITSRHISAMVKTAQQKFAAKYDDSRMQQISVGGMAGPFSKGVCKAATVDWFRRIDNGQPTWRHEGVRVLDRNGIDWEQKRDRLQAIQTSGQSADPLGQFDRLIYVPQQVHHATLAQGKVGLDTGKSFADALFNSAKQRFQAGNDPNQFFQLNVNLAGRVYGLVDHAIGIHATQVRGGDPNTAAGYQVHVFDANEREAVAIPGDQFGTWLSSHLTARYDDRVNSMMLCEVTKQHPEIPTLKFVGGPNPAHVANLQAGATEVRELRHLAADSFASDDHRSVRRGGFSQAPVADGSDRPAMPQQFWKDIDRQQMLVRPTGGDGPVRLTKDSEPERMLTDLAGSAEGAGHLASFMAQDLFSALNQVNTRLFSDGNSTGADLINPLPVTAQMTRRVEAARINDAGRDYVELTYAQHAPLHHLSPGGGNLIDLDDQQSRMDQTMKLRIAVDDLAAGRTDRFEIVDPPKAAVHAVLT